jgi:hypothetical protein
MPSPKKKAKRAVPYHDDTSPFFYELRAGFPMPDDKWYKNEDATLKYTPMTFF